MLCSCGYVNTDLKLKQYFADFVSRMTSIKMTSLLISFCVSIKHRITVHFTVSGEYENCVTQQTAMF